MKTKIFALILCLATLLTAVLPLSVSAEAIELKEATPPGALAISELNAAPLDNGTSYQYIEIVNLSTKAVDLSNYYLYRWGFSNTSGGSEYTGLQRMYGTNYHSSTTHVVKVNLNGTIPAGETMVVWLWVSTDENATCPTDTSTFINYWKTTLGKDASWTIENTAIANVDAYPATAVKNVTANAGFLPGMQMGCIIDLIHKDVVFNVNNGASVSKSKQTAATDALKVLDADDNASRHRAADCAVIFFPGVTANTAETAAQSHNFYSFVDPESYYGDCAALSKLEDYKYGDSKTRTVFSASQSLPTFAVGKLSNTGDYEVGSGARLYNNLSSGAISGGAIFFDDGTKEASTPGTLNNGQYGYENGLVIYGAQNKLDDTTQTVRFVGYIENVEKYTEVGFEIFGYTDNDTLKYYDGITATYYAKKAISVDTVYKSIQAGTKTTTVTEIAGKDGYLMAVAISGLPVDTASTDTLTLYVTPYGVIDNGDGSTTTVYGKRVALDLEVFDALNAAN